eukprot:gene7541-5320_t
MANNANNTHRVGSPEPYTPQETADCSNPTELDDVLMELNDLVQLLMDRRENVLCSQSPQSGADDAAVETMLRHILARISDPHLRTIVNWSQVLRLGKQKKCGGDPVAAGQLPELACCVREGADVAAEHGHLSAFVGVLLHQRQVPFFVSKFSISGNSDTEPRNIRITHKAQWDDVKRLRLEDYIRFQFDEGVEGGKIMLLDNRNSRRRSGIMYDDGTTIADFEKLLKGGLVWLVCMRVLGTLPVVGRLEWLQEREGLVWVCPVGVGFRRTRQVYYCEEEDDDCVYRLTVAEYGGRLPVSTGCRVGEGRFSAVMIPYGIPDVERMAASVRSETRGGCRGTGGMLYCTVGLSNAGGAAELDGIGMEWPSVSPRTALCLAAVDVSCQTYISNVQPRTTSKDHMTSFSLQHISILYQEEVEKLQLHMHRMRCGVFQAGAALHFPLLFALLVSALRLPHGWAMLMFDGASEAKGPGLVGTDSTVPLTGLGSVWRGGYAPERMVCALTTIADFEKLSQRVCAFFSFVEVERWVGVAGMHALGTLPVVDVSYGGRPSPPAAVSAKGKIPVEILKDGGVGAKRNTGWMPRDRVRLGMLYCTVGLLMEQRRRCYTHAHRVGWDWNGVAFCFSSHCTSFSLSLSALLCLAAVDVSCQSSHRGSDNPLLAQTALFPLTGLGSVWRGGYGPARLRGWCLPCSLLRAKRIENQVCGMRDSVTTTGRTVPVEHLSSGRRKRGGDEIGCSDDNLRDSPAFSFLGPAKRLEKLRITETYMRKITLRTLFANTVKKDRPLIQSRMANNANNTHRVGSPEPYTPQETADCSNPTELDDVLMELNDLVQLLMDRRENVLCSQSPQSGADDAAVETMLRHILARISDPHLRTIVNWSQCGGDPVAAGQLPELACCVREGADVAAEHGHLSAFVGVLLHQRQVPFFVSKFSISGNSDTEPRNIRITHKAQWDDVKRLRLEDYIRFQFDEGVEGGKIMLLDNRNSRRRSGIMYDDGTTIADFEKLLKGGLVWLVCMRFLGTLPVVGRLEWLQEREGLVWVCPVGVGFRRTRQVYYCEEEDDDCVYRLTVAEYGGRLPVSTGCRVGEGRFSAVMIPYGIPDVERVEIGKEL